MFVSQIFFCLKCSSKKKSIFFYFDFNIYVYIGFQRVFPILYICANKGAHLPCFMCIHLVQSIFPFSMTFILFQNKLMVLWKELTTSIIDGLPLFFRLALSESNDCSRYKVIWNQSNLVQKKKNLYFLLKEERERGEVNKVLTMDVILRQIPFFVGNILCATCFQC